MAELEQKFRTASSDQKAFARELLAKMHNERKKVVILFEEFICKVVIFFRCTMARKSLRKRSASSPAFWRRCLILFCYLRSHRLLVGGREAFHQEQSSSRN